MLKLIIRKVCLDLKLVIPIAKRSRRRKCKYQGSKRLFNWSRAFNPML